MVPSITRQSVMIKCNMQRAYLLGNYEYYYAAGLAANLTGFELPEDIKKRSLQQSVLEAKGTPKEVKDIIKESIDLSMKHFMEKLKTSLW